ncbi:MAG TPA: UvrD-helicase domain-containing protein, partial [Candidatus Binatia bacterium]
MSQATQTLDLPDGRDRQLAVRTFDRNLVVTAGAGTGKTTLLVDRLVHLILRDPDPFKVTEVVALTFTNKAADEMKLRLRERLQAYLAVELDRRPESDAERKTLHSVEELIALYRLSKDDMDGRIRDALRNLERSDIGTIHSFAANLLRLYPIEAGVDPQFREDDGSEFDRLFDEQWDAWLDQELALASPRADDWRKVLARCQLDQIKALARSLAAETVDLTQEPANGIAAPLRDWLGKLAAHAAALSARHPENRTNEQLVRAAHAVIYEFEKTGRRSEDLAEHYDTLAKKSVSRSLKGWSAEDIAAAQELVRAAKGLAGVDGEFTALL